MNNNKTIQLANGLAEEGDRVINVKSEEIAFVYGQEPDGSGSTLLLLKDENGKAFKALKGFYILAFSPTDALEAVEEEMHSVRATITGKKRVVAENVLKHLKSRIQQKRKGHE